MSELLTPSFPLKTMKMNPLEAFQIIEKISNPIYSYTPLIHLPR